ncbi:MAG: nucleotide sugar dehydrogenase [Patescibacteria group bacterium]|jgi:UDP-N-acetyl-D-galactosamine dehydrogenase|nr:nucleotide sugar dehydrogenase [Patescibacteria group bacterium]
MKEKICVVGLGYVGLPLACLLSKHFSVSGFDISERKIKDLQNGIDETGEIDNLKKYQLEYSANPSIISQANFIIVAVPTPITEDLKPDLTPLESASEIVGKNLQAGSVVVYESTVYPGCTREVCLPILEQRSGLKFGTDFQLGYSPERVNPGDRVHTIETITKIISASDPQTLARLKAVYGQITQVHEAQTIEVAEAAKVIENVQRSLNIALMNELSLIFDKLGINTKDVIEAAATKWNFHKYSPGLVGGHCIGVDPYYLTYKAQQEGYEPKIILSGQEVNESMAGLVAQKFAGKINVLVLGITFKENVPDSRNTKALNVMSRLAEQGSKIYWHDPVFTAKHQPQAFSAYPYLPSLAGSPVKFDGILLFSPHQIFGSADYDLAKLKEICNDQALIFDVKGFYNQTEVENLGFKYLTL